MSYLTALCTPTRAKKVPLNSSRGRSNFKQFSEDQRRILSSKYPFLTTQQIQKKVTHQWKLLSQSEKDCYHCVTKLMLTPRRRSVSDIFHFKQSNCGSSKETEGTYGFKVPRNSKVQLPNSKIRNAERENTFCDIQENKSKARCKNFEDSGIGDGEQEKDQVEETAISEVKDVEQVNQENPSDSLSQAREVKTENETKVYIQGMNNKGDVIGIDSGHLESHTLTAITTGRDALNECSKGETQSIQIGVQVESNGIETEGPVSDTNVCTANDDNDTNEDDSVMLTLTTQEVRLGEKNNVPLNPADNVRNEGNADPETLHDVSHDRLCTDKNMTANTDHTYNSSHQVDMEAAYQEDKLASGEKTSKEESLNVMEDDESNEDMCCVTDPDNIVFNMRTLPIKTYSSNSSWLRQNMRAPQIIEDIVIKQEGILIREKSERKSRTQGKVSFCDTPVPSTSMQNNSYNSDTLNIPDVQSSLHSRENMKKEEQTFKMKGSEYDFDDNVVESFETIRSSVNMKGSTTTRARSKSLPCYLSSQTTSLASDFQAEHYDKGLISKSHRQKDRTYSPRYKFINSRKPSHNESSKVANTELDDGGKNLSGSFQGDPQDMSWVSMHRPRSSKPCYAQTSIDAPWSPSSCIIGSPDSDLSDEGDDNNHSSCSVDKGRQTYGKSAQPGKKHKTEIDHQIVNVQNETTPVPESSLYTFECNVSGDREDSWLNFTGTKTHDNKPKSLPHQHIVASQSNKMTGKNLKRSSSVAEVPAVKDLASSTPQMNSSNLPALLKSVTPAVPQSVIKETMKRVTGAPKKCKPAVQNQRVSQNNKNKIKSLPRRVNARKSLDSSITPQSFPKTQKAKAESYKCSEKKISRKFDKIATPPARHSSRLREKQKNRTPFSVLGDIQIAPSQSCNIKTRSGQIINRTVANHTALEKVNSETDKPPSIKTKKEIDIIPVTNLDNIDPKESQKMFSGLTDTVPDDQIKEQARCDIAPPEFEFNIESISVLEENKSITAAHVSELPAVSPFVSLDSYNLPMSSSDSEEGMQFHINSQYVTEAALQSLRIVTEARPLFLEGLDEVGIFESPKILSPAVSGISELSELSSELIEDKGCSTVETNDSISLQEHEKTHEVNSKVTGLGQCTAGIQTKSEEIDTHSKAECTEVEHFPLGMETCVIANTPRPLESEQHTPVEVRSVEHTCNARPTSETAASNKIDSRSSSHLPIQTSEKPCTGSQQVPSERNVRLTSSTRSQQYNRMKEFIKSRPTDCKEVKFDYVQACHPVPALPEGTLCDMFQQVTPPQMKPSAARTRRILASGKGETTGNFVQLFKSSEDDIFL